MARIILRKLVRRFVAEASPDALLLESGDSLLLETGDKVLIE